MSPDPLEEISLQERLHRQMPHVRVTQVLIAVNVLVFMATLWRGAGMALVADNVQLYWGANFAPAVQDGEWWRLGSAMFLHFGLLHLAMNLWALWDAGKLVERMYGTLRFVLIYALCGISGNLFSLVYHRGGISGGASGAIFGIYGALLVFLWHERGRMHPHEFRWLFWGAAGFSLVIIVLGANITGIDNAAHVGGFLTGVLAGICCLPHCDRGLSQRAARIGSGLVLIAVWLVLLGRIPAPAYRWSEEATMRREITGFMHNESQIAQAWQGIVDESRSGKATFEDLAGRIEHDISSSYERSFEHLSQVPVSPELPSGSRVQLLRDYAAMRRDASRMLAEGLREGDREKISRALALWQRSGLAGRGASP